MDNNQLKQTYARFCGDYLFWVEGGAPVINNQGFRRDTGLCNNLTDWCRTQEVFGSLLTVYQDNLFELHYGSRSKYPFNYSSESYMREYLRETSFLNVKRIAWVTQHADPNHREKLPFWTRLSHWLFG